MTNKAEMDTRREVEITLDFPFDTDGQTISAITMRRPKVKDSLKADKAKGGPFEKGLALFADLTDLAPEQLVELDEVDLVKLQKQYEAFTGRATTQEG